MHEEINQKTVDFSDVNVLPANRAKYQSSMNLLFFSFSFSSKYLSCCFCEFRLKMDV